METAKQLLGKGKELNTFVSGLLDDIANLKAMLHAISIGARCPFRRRMGNAALQARMQYVAACMRVCRESRAAAPMHFASLSSMREGGWPTHAQCHAVTHGRLLRLYGHPPGGAPLWMSSHL